MSVRHTIKSMIGKLPGFRLLRKKLLRLNKKTNTIQDEVQSLKRRINQLDAAIKSANKATAYAVLQMDLNAIEERRAILQGGEARQMVSDLNSEGLPLVSIIIVNRDGSEHLRTLMSSFDRCSFYDNFEIILVDNNSEDDSVQLMKEYSDRYRIKIIQNSCNMSFSAANNLAVKESSGDLLLFMNNDTEVTNGWLDELLMVYARHERVGAVGAKLVYPSIPAGAINQDKSYRIQHAGIGFKGVVREGVFFYQPYNIGNGDYDIELQFEAVERACVTAAVLLVSRQAFDEVAGFDELYVYGYEDVDFCLKLFSAGYKNYYCPTCLVYHYEFGTQQKDESKDVAKRRSHNFHVLCGKWQQYLSRIILEDKIRGKHLFTNEPLTIAFAVTDNSPLTDAGDFFTASEFANSLAKLGFKTKLLGRRSKKHDWYDVGYEVDVLISLLDAYDLSKLRNYRDDIITIAWVRNHFRRWCEQPFFDTYTLVWSSSYAGKEYIASHSSHEGIAVLPIATNPERFNEKIADSMSDEEMERYGSDYVFTGSYWNAPRDIMDCLDPSTLPYRGKVYGANWEKTDSFRDIAQGFVAYSEIAKAYAGATILIDDANSVTKEFGSVNSRVFDALASGVLVLTNGSIGSAELFEGLLPVYSNKEELSQLITYYMENPEERTALTERLRAIVLASHTYDERALQLSELLHRVNRIKKPDSMAVDILTAMPDNASQKHWGDLYFANSMKSELERRGYRVNVIPRERWYRQSDSKYVIMLRGISEYYLPYRHAEKRYILWNISHPDDIQIAEINQYDYAFFASERLTDKLKPQIAIPASTLLQCTDPGIMNCDENCANRFELLFIGNSRGVFRQIIADLIPCEYKLTVFGSGWDKFDVAEYVVDSHIEYSEVGQAYHDAMIVLNDHWSDMRENGIVSNRIFDALAVGAFVISDDLPEIADLFDGAVVTYDGREDLLEKVAYYIKHPDARKQLSALGREIVLSNHTFEHRVNVLESVLSSLA